MCLASGHCLSTPPASSAYLSGALPSSPQSSSGPAPPGPPLSSPWSCWYQGCQLHLGCHATSWFVPQDSLWHEALTIVLWNLAPWFL